MKPAPFSGFTTPEFWDDEHISAQMLAAHLDPDTGAASRTHEFVARSASWIAAVLALGPGSSVLDLGCGPGLYSCHLARAGITVRGMDISRRSVAHAHSVAQDEGLPATFDVASYLDGGFWAEPPYEGIHKRFTYPDQRLVLDRFTITKDGHARQFCNWMHCLTPDQVTAELTAAGLALPDLWGDVAGSPYDATSETFAVVARRPAA
ncbi:SAM-dependent methyltransferase [Kribbella sp. NPDC054772]